MHNKRKVDIFQPKVENAINAKHCMGSRHCRECNPPQMKRNQSDANA